jgi:hypothetical protein
MAAINDNIHPAPIQGSRAYRWLSEAFEDRTVAEMSIHFCIIVTVSFIGAVFLALALVGPRDADPPPSDARIAAGMLTGFGLWLAFVLWLGISFVRIARRWGPERLGTGIFRLMQRVFLLVAALTMLARGVFFKELDIFLFVLLAFDFVILEMVVVFLLIAWLARCKVPWRTYRDIAVIVLVFVVQVALLR